MARSGTSAVAGACKRLGFSLGDDADQRNVFNPTGYFESDSVRLLNQAALAHVGATWYCPPPPAWDATSDVATLRLFQSRGPGVLARLGAGPILWKDPYAAPLLPLWRRVAGRPCAAVFVWRDPAEVAVSLWKSVRLPVRHGLALWAVHTAVALERLAGMPVFVCRYESLLANPEKLVDGVDGILHLLGWAQGAGGPEDREAAASFFSTELHRESPLPPSHPDAAVVGSLRSAQRLLDTLEGLHGTFKADDRPQVPQWAEKLFDNLRTERAEILRARRSLEAVC